MPTIQGKLNGNISGRVRFTPTHPFIDSSTTPETLIINAIEATFANSEFTINVPQSQSLQGGEAVTYKVEIEYLKGNTIYYKQDGTIWNAPVHQQPDGNWYTGATHTSESQLLDQVSKDEYLPLQNPFHAVIPDTTDMVDFTTLQGIPQLEPWLDIGIARLAELLTSVAKYRDRISSKLVIQGSYNAATTYEFGNVISFNGNGYVYSSNTPSANNPPPTTGNNAYWVMIAQKGEPGGTGAQIIGYNPTTWSGSSEAAARGDVVDAIQSIPNPDLSNYLTVAAGLPRNNPVMTGSAKRSVLNYPAPTEDLAQEIPTAQYVEQAIAQARISAIPKPIIFAKRASSITLGQNKKAKIIWNPRVIYDSTILDSNGIITIPEDGDYLFYLALKFVVIGNYQSNQGQQQFDCEGILYNQSSSADVGYICVERHNVGQATYVRYIQGMRYEPDISAGTQLIIQAGTYKIGTADYVISSSRVDSDAAHNYLLVWRVQ